MWKYIWIHLHCTKRYWDDSLQSVLVIVKYLKQKGNILQTCTSIPKHRPDWTWWHRRCSSWRRCSFSGALPTLTAECWPHQLQIPSQLLLNTHNKSDITKCLIFTISFKKKPGTEHEFPCLHSMLQPLFITITPPKISRKNLSFMSTIPPSFYIIIFQHKDHGWKLWTKYMYHNWIFCHYYEFFLL